MSARVVNGLRSLSLHRSWLARQGAVLLGTPHVWLRPSVADEAAPSAERPRRRRIVLVLVALLRGVLGLIPVFKWNQFATADSAFFSQYDLFSQSLVQAKIESTTPRAVSPEIPRAGLMIAQPNAGTVYGPFDGLSRGGSVGAQAYSPYLSNPGLQGYFFLGAYSVGCDSMGCLETLNSAFTALALLGFMLLLGTIAPRSFAAIFMLTAVFSPWIVSAARNLYCVLCSWLLTQQRMRLQHHHQLQGYSAAKHQPSLALRLEL